MDSSTPTDALRSLIDARDGLDKSVENLRQHLTDNPQMEATLLPHLDAKIKEVARLDALIAQSYRPLGITG